MIFCPGCMTSGWYDASLAEYGACELPSVAPGAHHVYHQYVVQVPDRDLVKAAMREACIATGIQYPIPIHEQPAYRYLGLSPMSLPVTHALCQQILSLPMFPGITRQRLERVTQVLGRAVSDVCVALA